VLSSVTVLHDILHGCYVTLLYARTHLGLALDAAPHLWAAEWLPPSIWQLITIETNKYFEHRQKLKKAAAEAEKKDYVPDSTDDAMLRFGELASLMTLILLC
jgi:hypothetical protein